MPNFKENIEKIRLSIVKNRENSQIPNKIKIIAVSKTFGTDSVLEAIQSGFFCFGENKVQECKKKFSSIIGVHKEIDLHMIGPLQTNKVKDALKIFNTIQTLDREKLCLEINKKLNPNSKTKDFFIQVNIGNEKQKSGINTEQSNDFIKWCINDLGINVVGLMCIPPAEISPIKYFKKLKTIAEENKLKYLSMGMSGYYLDAIICGATHIRLGESLFGKRQNYEK